MKLTGKVVRVESGSKYIDKRQRITLQVNDSFHGSLEVPNEDHLSLDDEVDLTIELVKPPSIEEYVGKIHVDKAF